MKTRFSSIQRGFTLIELIITIVIIGVLAAVAIPKFQSLNSDAEKGVALGVGAALASATSVNYSRSLVPGAVQCGTVTTGCYYPLGSCAAIDGVKAALADIPVGYAVSGSADIVGGTARTLIGQSQTCTLTAPSGATVTFSAFGA